MKKWLIIYDIRDVRRLTRIMKIVSEYATRVQRSVYELEADSSVISRIHARLVSCTN